MPGIAFLRDLYQHMAWADASVWSAVRRTSHEDDAQLKNTLVHLHLTQHGFLQLWRKEEVVFREADDFPSLAAVEAWARTYHDQVEAWLDRVSPESLDESLTIPWAHYFEKGLGGPAAPVTLGEAVYQVAAHTTYHRGQVNRRLRELGTTPPLVDYIAWVWSRRPVAAWPAD